MLRKSLCLLLVLFMVLPSGGVEAISEATHAKLAGTITLYINAPQAIVHNKWHRIDPTSSAITPIIRSFRTLVPVRFIAESLGASVLWEQATETVSITYGTTAVSLTIGRPYIAVNQVQAALDVAPVIHSGRTYLPLRALAEALGKQVFYERELVVISDEPVLDKDRDSLIITEAIAWFRAGSIPLWEGDPTLAAERRAAERRLVAEAIVEQGQQYLGTRYLFGATTGRTDAFDCSSFVQFLYRAHGVELPRRSDHQGGEGVLVGREELETGDLLFFDFGKRGPGIPDHVGIYVADDTILHSFPNRGVTREDMVWTNFIFAKRVIN